MDGPDAPDLDTALAHLHEVYRDLPLPDGDAALLAGSVVLELEGLTAHWDAVVRRNLARALTEVQVTEAALAISRRDGQLQPADHALWADLREELLGRVVLRPLLALLAA